MEYKKILLNSERIKSIVINEVKYENCNYKDNGERNGEPNSENTDRTA